MKSPTSLRKSPATPKKTRTPAFSDKTFTIGDTPTKCPTKSLDWNMQNQLLIAADTRLLMYDINDYCETTIVETNDSIDAISWVNDDKLVISMDGIVELWDPHECECICAFPSHDGRVGAISTIGNRVALGGLTGKITVNDIREPQGSEISNHNGEIYSLAWSTDGIHLASSGADRQIKIWGSQTKKRWSTKSIVNSLCWPTSSLVASGAQDGTISLMSTVKSETISASAESAVVGLGWLPQWGLVCGNAQSPAMWDLRNQELEIIRSFPSNEMSTVDLAVSHCGNHVATVGDGALTLVEIKEQITYSARFSKGQTTPNKFSIR